MKERVQAFLDRYLGVAGVLGVALALGAAAFYFSGLAPAEERLALLRTELARSERGAAPARLAGPEETLAAFYGNFGARQAAPGALREVFAAAAAEGLAVEAGEYKMAREPGARLTRYQIVLPVRGSYLAIRRFLVRALNEVPGLALESFDMRRESIASRGVEARLQLTLYLGDG